MNLRAIFRSGSTILRRDSSASSVSPASSASRLLISLSKGLAVALLLPLLLAGCANIGYYYQSVTGQLDIWWRERSIDEVFKDPATPAALRGQLATALK